MIITAVLVGVLFAAGTFLILQRTLTRIVLGLTMMSNGASLLLILSGGPTGSAPFLDSESIGQRLSDPMPQAMVLTAIVINFAMVGFLLALAYRSMALTGADEVEDDLEDRRIARSIRDEEIVAEIAEDLVEERTLDDDEDHQIVVVRPTGAADGGDGSADGRVVT